MSYYNEPSWSASASAPARQPSWEQPQPPSRSGTGHSGYNGGAPTMHMDAAAAAAAAAAASTVSSRDEPTAFASQFDGTLPHLTPCHIHIHAKPSLTPSLQKSNAPPRTLPRAESPLALDFPRPRWQTAVASQCLSWVPAGGFLGPPSLTTVWAAPAFPYCNTNTNNSSYYYHY